MEEERSLGDGLFWNIGQVATAPNGLTYGITYPGMMPFWGFGLEPNLWGDASMQQGCCDMPVMRHHMQQMQTKMMPIDVLYPKCHRMLKESVYMECNNFLNVNGGVMPNKIAKEEYCKMVERCTMQIMKNEDMFMSKLKENWACSRDSDENELENEEDETRTVTRNYDKLLIASIIGIMLIQELKQRGCMYCY